jgi:membrane protein
MNHWQVIRATFRAWWEDDVPQKAAALAYYAIFSMTPLLIITLGVTEFVLGKEAARGELRHRLNGLVGQGPAKAVEDILNTIHAPRSDGLFTGMNLAAFLFGSVWVFMALQDALNIIWKVRRPPGVGWIVRMRGRLLLFTLVLVTGLLLLTMLAASVTLATLTESLESSPLVASVLHLSNIGLSFILVVGVFAVIYKVVPEADVQWRHVWGGAVVSSLLHSLGNFAIGLWVGHCVQTSIYGAASSVIVILMWVYYSSLGFLLGAEYVHQRGEQQKHT